MRHTPYNEPLWLDWISGETNMTICKIEKWSDNCLSKWAKILVQGRVEDNATMVLLYFSIKSKKQLEPWPSDKVMVLKQERFIKWNEINTEYK